MSTVLTNGVIIPENGSRNWGGDLANNWNILDVNVGYMTDVKNRVTTLENSKQDAIEDLETIRAGASAGATAVQPSTLNDYVDLNSEQVISGAKTFSGNLLGSGSNNLGTSTNKWKTLNGVNPGALSLPSNTSITIDTTGFTWGTNFTFTPSVDGYLFISIGNSTGIKKLSLKTGRGECYLSNQIGILRFTLPVCKDNLVTMLVTSTEAETMIPSLSLFPCQGNV